MSNENLALENNRYSNYYNSNNVAQSPTFSEGEGNNSTLFGGQYEVQNGVMYDASIDDTLRNLYSSLVFPSNNNSQPINDDSSYYEDPTLIDDGSSSTLRESLEAAKDKQGVIGQAWDGIKNFFGVGSRTDELEKMVEQAENGEISATEVEEAIAEFEQKQDSVVDIVGNVASGLVAVASIALAPVTGGASLLVGAAAGGLTNVAVNGLEKATNEVENDYSAKDLTKDFVSGAVTGTITAATAGIGAGSNVAATTVKEAAKQGAIAGAKAGAVDGALSNAADYTIDCAFGDDEFSVGELAENAVTGAVVGGTVGAVVGGVAGAHQFNKAGKAVDPDIDINNPKGPDPQGTTTQGTDVASQTKDLAIPENTDDVVEKGLAIPENTDDVVEKGLAVVDDPNVTSSNTSNFDSLNSGTKNATEASVEQSVSSAADDINPYARTEFTQAEVDQAVEEFSKMIDEEGPKAYRRIAKMIHPDMYGGGESGTTFGAEIFKYLKNPARAQAH